MDLFWISVNNSSSFEVEWTELAEDKSSLSSLCFSLSEFAMFYIRANFRFFLCCNKVCVMSSESLYEPSNLCLLCILIMENTKKRHNSLSLHGNICSAPCSSWTQQRQALHCDSDIIIKQIHQLHTFRHHSLNLPYKSCIFLSTFICNAWSDVLCVMFC